MALAQRHSCTARSPSIAASIAGSAWSTVFISNNLTETPSPVQYFDDCSWSTFTMHKRHGLNKITVLGHVCAEHRAIGKKVFWSRLKSSAMPLGVLSNVAFRAPAWPEP